MFELFGHGVEGGRDSVELWASPGGGEADVVVAVGHIGGGHWSRSLCHGWSAAPAYFLSTKVLGVTAAAPGYSRVRIAPQPWTLRWARGAVPTPRGPVSVAWEVGEDGKLQIEYHVPDGCEVEVVLP